MLQLPIYIYLVIFSFMCGLIKIQFDFGLSIIKEFKYNISSLTGFIGGFMSLESNMNIAAVRVSRNACH